jgi:hypothetical protein
LPPLDKLETNEKIAGESFNEPANINGNDEPHNLNFEHEEIIETNLVLQDDDNHMSNQYQNNSSKECDNFNLRLVFVRQTSSDLDCQTPVYKCRHK